MRGFIAIEVGSEVSGRLSGLVREIKEKMGTKQATYPKEFHITLKFLGEFDEAVSLGKIKAAMDASCLGTGRFSLDVRGVGCFPSPKSPRVVFASARDDDGRLAELAAKIDSEMEKLGFARENRKFMAHTTLARLKERANMAWFFEKYGNAYFGSIPVNGMKLKKSTLTPAGPIYEDAYSVELGGR